MRVLPVLIALGVILGLVACVFVAQAAEPLVYVYHDVDYFHAGYFAVPKQADPVEFHRLMTQALCAELGRAGIGAVPIDAEGWAKLCAEKRRCIVVDLAQSVPETVYRGQDEGSPLEEWLDAGGILCYSGDWAFHWYALKGGQAGAEGAGQMGDDDIFDANLVKADFVGIGCQPTEDAAAVLPAFQGWGSARPFDGEAVREHCTWYELYGLGERRAAGEMRRAADPLAFRMPNGKGYFFGCRFGRSPQTDAAQMVYDFILRRGQWFLQEGEQQ